mgnify:CR=1 FL=1
MENGMLLWLLESLQRQMSAVGVQVVECSVRSRRLGAVNVGSTGSKQETGWPINW